MIRLKFKTFQDGEVFDILKENIVAFKMYGADYGSGEEIPQIDIWYLKKE